MNKGNMEAVKVRLRALGFDERLEEKLMAQVCFGPASFDLRFDKAVGEDVCTYLVHVSRGVSGGEYAVDYYYAYLRKGFVLAAGSLPVAARMSLIDWDLLAAHRVCSSVIVELSVLIEAGAVLAEAAKLGEHTLLLYKFWAGTTLESLIPDAGKIKAKYEMMQRYYISDQHPAITCEEAMRFLQNKWMERQMQQSRVQQRQADGGNTIQSSSGKNGKRRGGRKK
jgi:hypothetical protein